MKVSKLIYNIALILVIGVFIQALAGLTGLLLTAGVVCAVAFFKGKSLNVPTLVYNIAFALFLGTVIYANVGLPGLWVAFAIFCAGLLIKGSQLKHALREGLQREVWSDHIEGEIFKDNSFLKHAHRVPAENILGGRVVHIQQSGGSGNVVKNRQILPAKTRRREDTDVIYLLNDFSTDPVAIDYTAEKELSPNYRNSVLGEDRDKLVQVVAENAINDWLASPAYGPSGATVIPAANIFSTTGADGVNNNPLGNANRKKASITDLQTMRKYFKKIDRWFEGKMVCVLTPTMLVEMFPADSVTTATYMQSVTEEERRNGVMFKAQGWMIKERSSVAHVDNAGDVKVYDEALVATDDEASLFWYEEAVEFTIGSIEPFFKGKDPNNYGDTFSFMVYAGGRARRADYKGIALLKQAKTA